jgi:hypothetical protein
MSTKQIKIWHYPEVTKNGETFNIFKSQQKIKLWPDPEMTTKSKTF